MSTITDLLRDADPLRHEPDPLAGRRERIRLTVIAAASGLQAQSDRSYLPRILVAAIVTSIVIAIAAMGSRIWLQGSATLQAAAVRFEVRLAEESPAPGMQETHVLASGETIYLHQDIIVSNGDIARSRVVQGNGPLQFGVAVEFTATGAQKMRDATTGGIGKRMAIIVDGEVVTAPRVRSVISTSAVISGDYTKDEAERIANGISVQQR
jgi:preprotein translocase subunit SecD